MAFSWLAHINPAAQEPEPYLVVYAQFVNHGFGETTHGSSVAVLVDGDGEVSLILFPLGHDTRHY